MWNPFKKKVPIIPDFTIISAYIYKEKYFIKTEKWSWLNKNQIFIPLKKENKKIKTLTMEYWTQEMFLDANGTIKIKDYLNILIKQFLNSNIEIPKDLDVFMIETLEDLAFNLKIIKFIDVKEELTDELKKPMDK